MLCRLLVSTGADQTPVLTAPLVSTVAFPTMSATGDTAAPTLLPNALTAAFSVAPANGRCLTATVTVVAVAAITVPVAPPLSDTRLVRLDGSNPLPWIVNVVALRESVGKPIETRGGLTMVATATGAPLLRPLVVTVAESTPAPEGVYFSCTTSVVGDADTTLPVTPPSNASRYGLAADRTPCHGG